MNVAELGSNLERAFDSQLIRLASDLPEPRRDFAFVDWSLRGACAEIVAFYGGRRWRFDRAWPEERIAVELEGGRYGKTINCQNCGALVRARKADGSYGKAIRVLGWHARDERFQGDAEKYNAAQILGWVVLRFTNEDVEGNPFDMIAAIRQAFSVRTAARVETEALSPQQRELLRFLAGGWTTSEIGDKLNIKPRSIRRQTEEAAQRLCSRTRCGTVARAMACGILRPEEITWAQELSPEASR